MSLWHLLCLFLSLLNNWMILVTFLRNFRFNLAMMWETELKGERGNDEVSKGLRQKISYGCGIILKNLYWGITLKIFKWNDLLIFTYSIYPCNQITDRIFVALHKSPSFLFQVNTPLMITIILILSLWNCVCSPSTFINGII